MGMLTENPTDKPIYSHEAEKALIGAMMASPDQVIDKAMLHLDPSDFFESVHKVLYEGLCYLHSKEIEIDPLTFGQYLKDHDLYDKVGGAATIGDITSGVMTVLTAPAHIKTIKDKSKIRRLQKVCKDALAGLIDSHKDADKYINQTEQAIYEIREKKSTEILSNRQAILGALEAIQSNYDAGEPTDAIPTGYDRLDKEMAGGPRVGSVTVIGATPGSGKTIVAMEIAIQSSKKGTPNGMVALEMTPSDMGVRQIANAALVSNGKLRTGTATQSDMDKISVSCEELVKLPIFWTNPIDMDQNKLRAVVRTLVSKHDCKQVIIDYLQLIELDDDKKSNDAKKISVLMRMLKSLALVHNIHIIVVAQLNRKLGDGEPYMYHFLGSSGIEQNADNILLMWSEKSNDQGESIDDKEHVVNWKLEKQRNGPAPITWKMVREGSYSRFKEKREKVL